MITVKYGTFVQRYCGWSKNVEEKQFSTQEEAEQWLRDEGWRPGRGPSAVFYGEWWKLVGVERKYNDNIYISAKVLDANGHLLLAEGVQW